MIPLALTFLVFLSDDKNLFTLWPDISAYLQDIDQHYTHFNLKSINKDFWQFAIYYTHTPRKEQLLALKSKMKEALDYFVQKVKYKSKRFQKNLACLLPRLQRKFSSDPEKLMASGYYGRKMTEEELEAKNQSKLEAAQSRNDKDPLLALLHQKEFDYDYESDSMGKLWNSFHYKHMSSNQYFFFQMIALTTWTNQCLDLVFKLRFWRMTFVRSIQMMKTFQTVCCQEKEDSWIQTIFPSLTRQIVKETLV